MSVEIVRRKSRRFEVKQHKPKVDIEMFMLVCTSKESITHGAITDYMEAVMQSKFCFQGTLKAKNPE